MPKKLAAAGPAPDLEEAYEVRKLLPSDARSILKLVQVDEDISDDTEEKTDDAEDDDISHDSLIKMPKGKGKAAVRTSAGTKAKSKAKK